MRVWKTEDQKDFIINAIWKHHKLTFSILVTFGWAVFASFPVFYATSFGWAYLVWMAILFLFIAQSVSFEYRKKENNYLWQKTYDTFLFLNWFLVPLLLWVAVGTFFTWSRFIIEPSNLVNWLGNNVHIASWTTQTYGLEALWNTFNGWFILNIALWLTLAFLVQILALLYVIHHVKDKTIVDNAHKCLLPKSIIFLVVFLIFVFKLMTITWFAYDSNNMIIVMEKYKYLHNLLDSSVIYSLFMWGTFLVLLWIWLWLIVKSRDGFWFTWAWTFFVVLSVFLLAWFNWTSFYPSLSDLQSSLTIQNASSSHYTLIVMSYVSLMLPFVLMYIIWAWNVIAGKQMTKTDLNKWLEKY
jgi:cytochrome d ubiquinol oxidase subunit II